MYTMLYSLYNVKWSSKIVLLLKSACKKTRYLYKSIEYELRGIAKPVRQSSYSLVLFILAHFSIEI